MHKPLLILAALIGLLLCVTPARADEGVPAEIEFLLQSIGNSDCVFIRNGKRHDAKAAEEHLRMKYRRGKRYAPTTEAFIKRLASASSMSRKPYEIECPGEAVMPAGDWLRQRLAKYRSQSQG